MAERYDNTHYRTRQQRSPNRQRQRSHQLMQHPSQRRGQWRTSGNFNPPGLYGSTTLQSPVSKYWTLQLYDCMIRHCYPINSMVLWIWGCMIKQFSIALYDQTFLPNKHYFTFLRTSLLKEYNHVRWSTISSYHSLKFIYMKFHIFTWTIPTLDLLALRSVKQSNVHAFVFMREEKYVGQDIKEVTR